LNNDYSENKEKKDLQLEAKAHINVHKTISDEFLNSPPQPIPTTEKYLKYIHAEFYKYLPEDFKKSKTIDGDYKIVVPGEFRSCEVKVGNHIAPHSEHLNSFMERFESFYNPMDNSNSSKVRRIISIAASHHRLAWIHPFLDGNGRVVRLYSDSYFMF
jgi:Fic family protein